MDREYIINNQPLKGRWMVFYTQDSNFNSMISDYPLMHAISFVHTTALDILL